MVHACTVIIHGTLRVQYIVPYMYNTLYNTCTIHYTCSIMPRYFYGFAKFTFPHKLGCIHQSEDAALTKHGTTKYLLPAKTHTVLSVHSFTVLAPTYHDQRNLADFSKCLSFEDTVGLFWSAFLQVWYMLYTHVLKAVFLLLRRELVLKLDRRLLLQR